MKNENKYRKAIDNVRNHGWQILDLKNCGLREIPDEIFEFDNLRIIDLGNDPYCDVQDKNQILFIPSDIKKLRNLVKLVLSDNDLDFLSSDIVELPKLKYLDLRYNRLKAIPDKLASMSSMEELLLEGNPFDLIPPEIVAQGISSIRNFFVELEEKDFLYEVKLLIVGQGRVGKTCLSKALTDDSFSLDSEESTEGINISRLVIPYEEIKTINEDVKRDFQINIWDFGGQEIYHSTHQFFLTKRSLYLLVTESRKEDSHDDFFYWLNIIKLLGDKSPIMIVLNKCDQPTKEIPYREYKDNFSNLSGFHRISLKSEFKEQLLKFKHELLSCATRLPHIGNALPKVWVDIRKEIEVMKDSGLNYISESEYLNICRKHYRKDESSRFLSAYFHDLGVFLHFQDDWDLKETIFLNHEWLTAGVYRVLDDREVLSRQGKFSRLDLERIWSDPSYQGKRKELLALMKNKKFDLCFELPTGDFLVPRLLPVDEIDHGWISEPNNKRVEFLYKFMPKGILSRIIVKLNSDIAGKKYWRYGVLLNFEGAEAIVRERYFESKITIELKGKNTREYLFTIRKALLEIHKDFNNIIVHERVPCNCEMCSSSLEPHFFDYETLKRYEYKGIAKIRCDKSIDEVDVLALTSDFKGISDSITMVACENTTADLLNSVGFHNVKFHPERDSASVFITVKGHKDLRGLRDRDFLLDSEIEKIKKKYPNYYILEYYCFENYLYHPENLASMGITNFDIHSYRREILDQKKEKIFSIISNFKNSRKNYAEFKVESEKIEQRKREDDIMNALKSDEFNEYYKFFSMKDHFNKNLLEGYNLTQKELAHTQWFKEKMLEIMPFIQL